MSDVWQATRDVLRRTRFGKSPSRAGEYKVRVPDFARPPQISMQPGLSGTTCYRPSFMCEPGIVQRRFSRSNSLHLAPRTSPDRVAVKIRNCSADEAIVSRDVSVSQKFGRSSIGRAGGRAVLFAAVGEETPGDPSRLQGFHQCGACKRALTNYRREPLPSMVVIER